MSIVCLILATQPSFAQASSEPSCNIYYVDQNATGPVHDGSSWCSGFLKLSDALLVADECDTIRVANGVYTPSTQGLANPREANFEILGGMTWEGGFQGCDAHNPEVRDIDLYETVLSGDLNSDDETVGDNSENAYNVITADGALEVAIIDGFSIAHGNANSGGGGLFAIASAITISRCNIYDNHTMFRGGGLSFQSANVAILNTRLHDNVADVDGGAIRCFSCNLFIQDSEISSNEAINGGGIYVFAGTLTLERAIIRGNRASELTGSDAGGGGGLALFSAIAIINNSLLVDNTAAHAGAVFLIDHHINVTNSTIVRNTATNHRDGGGFRIQSGTMDITNSIVWGNRGGIGTTLITTQIDWGSAPSSVSYSHNVFELWNINIERFLGSVGNFNADPLFIDDDGADNIPGTSNDDFRLSSSSPCINRGDPILASPIGATDLYGNDRSVGCRTDIGAYESTKINIDNDYDSDDQITLADYAKLQFFWGAIAGTSNEADAYVCVFDTSNDGEVNLDDLPDFVEKLEEILQSLSPQHLAPRTSR